MPTEMFGSEQIVTKLRQIEVLLSQGNALAAACRDLRAELLTRALEVWWTPAQQQGKRA
jgi:hypothetical protein